MALSKRERAILKHLEGVLPAMRTGLKNLVAVSSHTSDKEGVDRVGEMLEKALLRLGFRVAEMVGGGGGRSLVARHPASPSHRLLLLGHLDTVPASAADLTEDPARPGRLKGSGAADMKGGLVVLLHALEALDVAGALPDRQVTVILSAEEEVGSPRVRDVVSAEALESHLCLGLEPGRALPGGASSFVTSRKGMGRLRLRACGQSAHAGVNPDQGASAIRELAWKVTAMEKLNDPEQGLSVTVGLFTGGSSANTVPGEASLTVDYRYPDAAAGLKLEEALLELARTPVVLSPEGQPLVATLIEEELKNPPMETSAAMERMARRVVAWGADLDLLLVPESRGGSSDAVFAAQAGCPALCGLGVVGGGWHTPEEWILTQSLLDRAQLLALTMERFFCL